MDLQNNSRSKTTPEQNVNRSLNPIGHTVEKKTVADKFQQLFLADTVGAIKTHIFEKIIVPNLVRFVADTMHGAVDAFFYKRNGQAPFGGYTSWNSGASFVNNYGSYFNAGQTVPNNNDISMYKYLAWPTRELAEQALIRLRGEIVQYQAVSINTYLSLMDRTGPINGWNFGWKNLDQANVFQSGGMWYISFPEPIKIR